MRNLRQRILNGASDLRVDQIIHPDTMRRIPPPLDEQFGSMIIKWLPNRSWGQSFALPKCTSEGCSLGDKHLLLGHRRGDHIAMHPEIHGLDEYQATEFLRRQVEGTCLHEFGHAILDKLSTQEAKPLMRRVRGSRSLSTYQGMGDRKMSPYDIFHEDFAEATRYYLAAPEFVSRRYPEWSKVVQHVLARATLRENPDWI